MVCIRNWEVESYRGGEDDGSDGGWRDLEVWFSVSIIFSKGLLGRLTIPGGSMRWSDVDEGASSL